MTTTSLLSGAQARVTHRVHLQESMWAALHTATTPLLLVTGQADEKFGVISGHIQKVARASRSVTSVSVPGAGHAVQEERPWAVVAALAQWLPTVST